MAYTRKAGKRYQIRQGNTCVLLHTFTGKGALNMAKAKLRELHAKYHPMAKNRGKVASNRCKR